MTSGPQHRVLVVHHTPSPAVQELVDAALRGLAHPDLVGVDVRAEPALSATVSDVLAADGLVLITPANIGYMSGALKHFFDTIYYPCLDATGGRPMAVVVHGNDDTTGAVRSVERIAQALGWRAVAAPVSVVGPPGAADRGRVADAAATVAAEVESA